MPYESSTFRWNNSNKGKKILIACAPADGHFNPLTGLAKHLQSLDYDVRWYSSNYYAPKLNKLGIQHYPFKRALDVVAHQLDKMWPQRSKIRNPIRKLNFDLINYFILRSTEYLEDIQEIHESFDFDLMIADCTFVGIPLVKKVIGVPVISVGIVPLGETSKDLPPSGLGLTPAETTVGKVRDVAMRWIAKNLLFRKSNKVFYKLMGRYGIEKQGDLFFDVLVREADYLLQIGSPGFEYRRSDLGANVRFVGTLLPHSSKQEREPWFDERLNKYEQVVLVTQGTVEKNVNKLLVPTIEAFKGSKILVVVTTGGSKTAELRAKYPYDNIIIEDFIPFTDVMPYADAYVTNGGYGGVMLGISNNLPLVVAGIHEGKNEINARVGFFNLGINLKTENPIPLQIRNAVIEVITNGLYKRNIALLREELSTYDALAICQRFVEEILPRTASTVTPREFTEGVYVNN
ncbi:MAG: glycosyltransferase [Chitinophagaceae bacterium]|nr:glycosyltransferase [Chitinophagaceae bacterium]